MIRKINDIIDELSYEEYISEKYDILKLWAESIIDECWNNIESKLENRQCEMGEDDNYSEAAALTIITRKIILNIKEQL